MDLDFGYGGNGEGTSAGSDKTNDVTTITDVNNGGVNNSKNGEAITDINDGDTKDVADGKDKNDNTDSDDTLQSGTTIEVGDDTYTIDDSGNVIDKDGNVYKEAKDVKEWLKSFDKVDDAIDAGAIDITSIQEAVGIEITDDNDKPIEFENTPAGVKAYIDAVIDTAKEEHFETAINTLYQKYPILNDVLNYYIANGNSLEGFGEYPDRSNITIDESNEAQQESIIRTAWKERNQKGDVEGYIAYLKSSGTLLSTAKDELTALQEADEEYRANIAKEAEKKENERIKNLEKYWNGVEEVIKTRKIAGYQIPESIIINRNGQKLSVTPNDFFNYIYRVDKDGKSAYERDLEKETMESRRDDEILRAYLKFVGGNYSNLVDMAVNKDKVAKLKLKAKERRTSTVRINKPATNKQTGVNIDFGYN